MKKMEIVLATRNKKKIEEIRRITAGFPINILSLDNFPECPETASIPFFPFLPDF